MRNRSRSKSSLLPIAMAVFLCLAGAPISEASSTAQPERRPLPAESGADHAANASLDLGPFRMHRSLPRLEQGRLIRLEASYDESIALKDVLLETMRHNLPIRISKESWNYQKYQLFADLSQFLPSFNMGYNITGSLIGPGHIGANAKVFSTQITYPVFQGGSVLYNSLAQYYRNVGWHHAYQSTINDALMDAYNKYSDLALQDAILRIREHALALSSMRLDLNTAMYEAGTATQFAVMQSRTQLALDREAHCQQQMATRQAALELAYVMNMPMAINLIPREPVLKESDLFPDREKLSINDYVSMAVDRRPELRQYEMYRLAAARTVQTAAAALYPAVSFYHSYADTSVTASDSSDSASTTLENAGVFTGDTRNFQLGFNLTWTLSNMGLLNTANVVSARALSRQAMVQANQELVQIMQQVRTGYDATQIARERIDSAAYAADSGREALRLAHLRLKTGLGTNLELIQAQRSYIDAVIAKARAITASNKAQAALLHSTGLISVDTLVDGYTGDKEPPAKKHSLFKF
ncbi:MAG: TolC family protein [Candidatus Obscuribacterales bacterium]